jgi:hypothetical protein
VVGTFFISGLFRARGSCGHPGDLTVFAILGSLNIGDRFGGYTLQDFDGWFGQSEDLVWVVCAGYKGLFNALDLLELAIQKGIVAARTYDAMMSP